MDLEDLFFSKVALSEEHDCSAHTVKLRVRYEPRPLANGLDPNVVAGHLRVIGAAIDNYCVYRGARSADFRNSGMVFRFTDEAKRDQFRADCAKYLSERGFNSLVFTPF